MLVIAISMQAVDACKGRGFGLYSDYLQTYLRLLYYMAIAGCFLVKPGKEGEAGTAADGLP